MASVAEDYKRPLKEIYESFPEKTQISLNKDISKIWKYFIFWCIFVILSIIAIVYLIGFSITNETLGERIQRAGSIIPLFAILGEVMFVVKLNKLASVIHPAQLTYEIYKERRFKPLLNISLIITILFTCLGAVLSGYGDFLYEQYNNITN